MRKIVGFLGALSVIAGVVLLLMGSQSGMEYMAWYGVAALVAGASVVVIADNRGEE